MKNSIILKLGIILLTACLVCGHVCVSASAYEYSETDRPVMYEADIVTPAEVLKKYADIDELRAYLLEGFSRYTDERIELSKYNIAKEDAAALKSFIWREMPELFHVDVLRVYNNGTIITAIGAASYKYAETKEQYDAMVAEYEEKADVLLDGIIDNDSLSDTEKALLIHDRLAVNCSYCYDSTLGVRYTMYGALVRGLAVCEGYTRAYAYLLRRCGIESINCASDALNHTWNLVLIDGNYYHVDVTYDDPSIASGSRSLQGLVRHDYFLLSDSAIKAKKHDADDYINTLAKSTKYDNYFWQCTGAEFQLVKGDLYYFDHDAQSLMRLNEDRVSGTALYSVDDIWWSSDRTYYWDGNYSRLSSDGIFLYFSTSDKIYSYNPSNGDVNEIFKPDLKNGDLIYGFTYRDGNLIIDTNDRPAGKGDRLDQIIQPYSPQIIKASLRYKFYPIKEQSVFADIVSANGISGYYFGTYRAYTEKDIKNTTESVIPLMITEPGTYYFVAFDENGTPSEAAEITFKMITLHPNGGTVENEYIVYEENTEFFLPDAVHEQLYFAGWTDDENSGTGILQYKIDRNTRQTDFYATWISGIPANVTTVGAAAVNVTLLDADGNPVSASMSESGTVVIEPGADTVFVEITAPGHVGQIFTVGTFTGADIALALIGDSNGDNELDNKDVTVLFRSLSKAGAEYSDPSDVNADGTNDNKDVVLLFRSLSDPSIQLVPHSVRMY